MFEIDSDEDEDLLAVQIDQIESKYRQRNNVSELNDYEFALKLSQQLNKYQPSSKNTMTASTHQNIDNAVHEDLSVQVDQVESKYRRQNDGNELNDPKFTLKLSQKNGYKLSSENLATNSGRKTNDFYHDALVNELDSDMKLLNPENVDADYLLALKFSQADTSPIKNDNKVDADCLLAVKLSQTQNSRTKRVHNVDDDYLLALQLSQADYSPTKPAHKFKGQPQSVNTYFDKTTSVVDPSWETIDPNPDIYALFIAFNQRFFWGRLDMVEVKWSPRMTLCAGICSYHKRAGHCTVKLSKPLLKYRPRKDLVETLLHEMIHAYLFVTKNDKDRDGHGPQFHSHMYRINKESGANITVYHSFHEEVKSYQTHWWKCDGPCQFRSPFFGFVKRSTNRAPGPYDRWWNDHRATCDGTFQKVKEPEDYGKKKLPANKKTESRVTDKPVNASIQDYFNRQKLKSSTECYNFTSCKSENKANATSSLTNPIGKMSSSTLQNKKIFTLSDLSKHNNKKSPSKSPKKWSPLPGQRNILHFVNKS